MGLGGLRQGAALVAAIGLAALAAGPASSKDQPCDRACLRGVLDAYLTAVIRHDVAGAPLAPGYRATENGVEVKAGEGFWKTATGLGAVQRRYLDPVNGTAAFFGLFGEDGAPAVMSLRIKVEGRKVKEAEYVFGRPGAALYSPAGLIAEPPSDAPAPKEGRVGRADLQRAANSYFDGLEAHSGAGVLHHDGCVRLENGTKVTQRTAPSRPPAGAAPPRAGQPNIAPNMSNEFGSGDCARLEGQTQIRAVVHRRFPVIDEEAQVALGTGMFLRPEGSTRPRLLLTEVFSTRAGKITAIHAAMNYLTPTAPETTGW